MTEIQPMFHDPALHLKDWRVVGYCLIISIAIMTLGLDTGETSGFLAMTSFKKDFGEYNSKTRMFEFSARDQTRMYGIELGFATVGCVVAGIVGSHFGRKICIIITAVLCMVGAALQMIAATAGLLVGRGILGLGIAFAGIFSIAYWSEVAPVRMRGQIVILFQVFITVPSFVGTCINQGTHNISTAMAYRIPLIVAVLLPFILLLLIWVIPESPRWLVARERIDEAKISLRRLQGHDHPQEELERQLRDVIAFTAIEKEISASTSYRDCFKGTDLRRTMISLLLFTGQQFTGVAFLAGFLTLFFSLVGVDNAFVVACINNSCAIVGALSTFAWIRLFGRRTILIVGGFACSICMLLVAIIPLAAPKSTAADSSVAAFVCIFTFSFSASWGSVVPVVVGEVPSNRLRSKTVAIGYCSYWAWALAIVCGAPYLISTSYANIGTKIGFIFGGLMLIVVVLTIWLVPETRDRSLEEIDEMFMNRVPSWKFTTYKCTGVAQYLSATEVFETLQHKQDIEMIERATITPVV